MTNPTNYLTMRGLIEAAAKLTPYTVEEITGPRKFQRFVLVRACVVHIAEKQRTGSTRQVSWRWTLPRIAKALGYKDHTTVVHLRDKWPHYCREDPSLPALAEAIHKLAMHPKKEEVQVEESVVVSIYTKGRNDFRPEEEEEEDGSHRFHQRTARASMRFAQALLAAKKEAM